VLPSVRQFIRVSAISPVSIDGFSPNFRHWCILGQRWNAKKIVLKLQQIMSRPKHRKKKIVTKSGFGIRRSKIKVRLHYCDGGVHTRRCHRVQYFSLTCCNLLHVRLLRWIWVLIRLFAQVFLRSWKRHYWLDFESKMLVLTTSWPGGHHVDVGQTTSTPCSSSL